LALGALWALIALRSGYSATEKVKRCLWTILAVQGVAVIVIIVVYIMVFVVLKTNTAENLDQDWFFEPFKSNVHYLAGAVIAVLISNRLIGRFSILKLREVPVEDAAETPAPVEQ
jgi:hypothetical protein